MKKTLEFILKELNPAHDLFKFDFNSKSVYDNTIIYISSLPKHFIRGTFFGMFIGGLVGHLSGADVFKYAGFGAGSLAIADVVQFYLRYSYHKYKNL